MLEIKINNKGTFKIKYAVFDLNGTLSVDGIIDENIKEKLERLKDFLEGIFILTSDTFNTASKLNIKGIEIHTLDPQESASIQKQEFIRRLGKENTIAFGNGYNDHLMLKEAAIGICIIGKEGAHPLTLENSDIIVKNPEEGLDLLFNTKRIAATLRD